MWLDVWGIVFRVTVYFCVSGIFGESMRYLHSYGPEVKYELVCREQSCARIDIVIFWGDMKWCLWKACWMYPIHIQLGFLVRIHKLDGCGKKFSWDCFFDSAQFGAEMVDWKKSFNLYSIWLVLSLILFLVPFNFIAAQLYHLS